MRSDIQKMIADHSVYIPTTVSKDAPHCWLMIYATDDSRREIYMATLKDTKQCRHLLAHPSLSLLMDARNADPAGTRALTIGGDFHEAADDRKAAAIRELLIHGFPHLKESYHNPNARILAIKITSLQLPDGATNAVLIR